MQFQPKEFSADNEIAVQSPVSYNDFLLQFLVEYHHVTIMLQT